jgi:putative ABC transport system substrate-binding protein
MRAIAAAWVLSLVVISGCVERATLPVRARPARAVTVGIAFWKANVPEYVDAAAGFRSGMEELGYRVGPGVRYLERDAGGDLEKMKAIFAEWDGKVDLIVTTGTACSQAAAAVVKRTPVVFTAVFDPVAAGIAQGWHRPGGRFAGVSCKVPLSDQVEVLQRLLPKAKRMGIVFNPEEANSRAQIAEAKSLEKSMGLQVVESPLEPGEADLGGATRRLAGKVDVVFAPADTVVAANPQAVIAAAQEVGLPVFSALAEVARAGALMALGPNFYVDSKRAAEMADLVFRGVRPGAIPVAMPKRPRLVINVRAADRLGIKVAPLTVSLADEVVR